MSFANFDYEAQKPLKKKSDVATDPQNELDIIIEKTSKQLESFGGLVSQFEVQRKQIGTKRDSSRLRSNIDILISKISNLESAIHILIDNISSVINRNQKGGSISISNKQIVIKERLESEFNGLHKQFQLTTRTYKEKKRLHPIKDDAAISNAVNATENTPLIRDQEGGNQQSQQQLQLQEEEINETELQYHLLLTEERNQEINQINEGILEINSIFKDLGELVNQQGEQLDTIEENILQLHGHTQQAEQELVKANEYQRKKGKWSCIILVALCVFVLVVVLAVIS